jgi:hypothetical protein
MSVHDWLVKVRLFASARWPKCKVLIERKEYCHGEVTACHPAMRGPIHIEHHGDRIELCAYQGATWGGDWPMPTSVATLPVDAPLEQIGELLDPHVNDWVPEDERWGGGA